MYPTDCEEAIRYWSYGTDQKEEEENDDDDEAEEAVIKSQETEDIED
jgi:hypothetical protein